ncbi:Tmn3 protein [Martiniozyma asiatica (nom. inval.)]|nr:Tmn3 protein [Martiniozyma asiatica]
MLAFLLLLGLSWAWNFQLPFSSTKYYSNGDKVDLLVNTVDSPDSPSLAYYKLPFVCPATAQSKPVHLSISEILNGDRFWQTDYRLEFGKDEHCLRICDRIISQKSAQRAYEMIKNDYVAEWVIDNLPGSTTLIQEDSDGDPKKYYVKGFALGFMEDDIAYFHNHVMLVIRWHKEGGDENKKTIVGFEVYPKSVSDSHCPGASRGYQRFAFDLEAEKTLIPFTYSVYWREETEISYANRWKLYINPDAADESWTSLINSIVLIAAISFVLAIYIIRSDFSSNVEIFVEPKFLRVLSILTGSGVQLLFTFLGLCIFLLFGMSTDQDTTVLTAIITLFLIGGFFGGFSAIQFYKTFSTKPITVKRTILIASMSGTCLLILSFCISLIPNFIVYSKKSPRFIRFGIWMVLILGYIFTQLPISLMGGLISLKFDYLSLILRSSIPKPKTATKNFTRPSIFMILLPLLPVLIILIQLKFLYRLLFINKSTSPLLYFSLLLTLFLLLSITAQIGIISTRLYGPHWNTFLTISVGVFIYLSAGSLWYIIRRMKLVDAGGPILFAVYSGMAAFGVAVALGAWAVWCGVVCCGYSALKTNKKE